MKHPTNLFPPWAPGDRPRKVTTNLTWIFSVAFCEAKVNDAKLWSRSGWWFQPIWKICSSKWVHLPQIGVKIKNVWNHHPSEMLQITWDLHDLGSIKSKKIFGKSTAYQLLGMISFHEIVTPLKINKQPRKRNVKKSHPKKIEGSVSIIDSKPNLKIVLEGSFRPFLFPGCKGLVEGRQEPSLKTLLGVT